MGGITTATTRLAATDMMLKVPISRDQGRGDQLRGDGDAHRIGEPFRPAAADQPPRPRWRDDNQRRGRRHRQRESKVDGQFRRPDIEARTDADSAGSAWRRR